MNKDHFIVVEEDKSPLRTILRFVTAVLTIGAACAVAYKYLEKKYSAKVLGRIDLDGDGVAEAIMLDTTGNGEVDTIIIDADTEAEDAE
ncbi:MAG: hypothetical protein IKJ24_06025 [Clostridia bacterium]|nr:hypothetical protein [Clostridia bacterium]